METSCSIACKNSGCSNSVVFDRRWHGQYCSADCIVKNCRFVFENRSKVRNPADKTEVIEISSPEYSTRLENPNPIPTAEFVACDVTKAGHLNSISIEIDDKEPQCSQNCSYSSHVDVVNIPHSESKNEFILTQVITSYGLGSSRASRSCFLLAIWFGILIWGYGVVRGVQLLIMSAYLAYSVQTPHKPSAFTQPHQDFGSGSGFTWIPFIASLQGIGTKLIVMQMIFVHTATMKF
ncbi:unnamed protein product [Protopolystoma xenopodis]|uniref:Uncharacterized protein n=1 Tax=Protopolystoma xenopodis TaxID=117903 RepID=A0A448WPV6_9PLAT|nr:unnamed protein product [Protopolystoma xenopodis]